MSNCLIDEGRSLGTGLQERVPNRLRWLWSKAMVVSAEGIGLERTRSGEPKPGSWERRSSAGGPISLCRAGAPRFAQRVIAQNSPRRRKHWGWPRLTGMNCRF